MDSIRIGQITDLHLRRHTPGSSLKHKNRSREMPAILEKALKKMHRAEVDMVVLTGDLVEAPAIVLKNTDYYMDLVPPFRETIREDYRMIRRLLDASGLAWMVLPGNKDVPSLFREAFGDQPPVRDIRSFRFVSFADRQWKGLPRRIDRERRLMEEVLAPDAPGRQIHLQHYLSAPAPGSAKKHRYLESETLRRSLEESGKVLLSLSGHYHPGAPPLRQGATTWYSAPALCTFPHPITIHNLDAEGRHEYRRIPLKKAPHLKGKPVVFLDRDGVINSAHSYYTGPEEMALIPGAARAVRLLKEAGYAVMVNTNQSCIGKGYVPESVVQLNHEYMCYLMSREEGPDAQPDAIFYSKGAGKRAVHPSLEDLSRTKPSPLLLEKAFTLFRLRKEDSWMIGDRKGDLRCGLNGGIRPLLVLTGKGKETREGLNPKKFPGLVVKEDLLRAAQFILKERARTKEEK